MSPRTGASTTQDGREIRATLSIKHRYRLYGRVALCAVGVVFAVVSGVNSLIRARHAAPPRSGSPWDRRPLEPLRAAETWTPAALAAAGRSLRVEHSTVGRGLAAVVVKGAVVPTRAQCPDAFFCAGRTWMTNGEFASRHMMASAEYCGKTVTAASTCKVAEYCQTAKVDCNCCHDGIAGRECRTRLILQTDVALASAKLSAALSTFKAARYGTLSFVVEESSIETRTYAVNGTVQYELLFAMPPLVKGSEIMAMKKSLKEVGEEVVKAFKVQGEADTAVTQDSLLVPAGVNQTSVYLVSQHEVPVSSGGADGNQCHPCCYTRDLKASFGGRRNTHPNFKGDYEACLNTRDGFTDNADGTKTLRNGTNGKPWVIGGDILDDSCTTMAGYFEMAVSAYEGAGPIVYIIGILYMLAGLAIVCDEYFVPALEVITDRLDLSNDVAGATLMAAGGSAPELATSFIGLFVVKSDVGFGTIVGSAVFNVLFVIGCCALASKELLVLTSWPLTRDCSYYIFSLMVLYIFFGAISPNVIEIWEAIVLLLMYVGYVVLMKFNHTLKDYCHKRWHHHKYKVRPVDQASADGSSGGTPDVDESMDRVPELSSELEKKKLAAVPNPRGRRLSTQFRAGILKMVMTHNTEIVDQLAVKAVSGIKGDVETTFHKFDENNSGFIDKTELGHVLKELTGVEQTVDMINDVMSQLVSDKSKDSGGKDQISFKEFKVWYNKSEARVMADVKQIFDEIDTTNDGRIDKQEVKAMIERLSGSNVEQATIDHAMTGFEGDTIGFKDFTTWYTTSMFFKDHKQKNNEAIDKKFSVGGSLLELEGGAKEKKTNDGEGGAAEPPEEDDDGVILWPLPEGIQGKIVWFLLLPISIPMFITIPDVRWKTGPTNWENWYPITFFMAIVWIGVFSFLMVWWATVLGDLIGISQAVMGLTFLAAGTSVPDLLTSVSVARMGFGDMAVSSSIGSNIFDILIGLPLPWLVMCIVNAVDGKPAVAQLAKEGTLSFSIIVLVLMLFAVISTIALNKFAMTKKLGATMFCLYGVFLAQDLLRYPNGPLPSCLFTDC